MKRYHLFFLKTFSVLLLTTFTLKANALLPYKYSWTKIKSDHFTVIVEKEHLKYGEIVAAKAERAFQALQSFSNKHPKRTFIIIDHTKGFSNGSATFFPYPIITLQPVAPAPSTSVGQYKDWLYELLVHEYTHILSFHNTKGLFTPLRWVFGSAVAPGYFMPTWYQEGIAVFTETHLSEGGRLRSSSYQALKKELKAHSISIANENDTGKYPFGSSPYVYGAWLNQLSTDSIEGASKIHNTFSGRIPYFINGGFKKHTNQSLYRIWKETFRKKENQLDLKTAFQGAQPFWSREDNKLYYIQRGAYLASKIVSRDGEEESKTLMTSPNVLQFKVHKGKIYYLGTSLSKASQDSTIFSLFSFDIKKKKETRMSFDENIHAFDISTDGKIAFISAKINQQQIKISHIDKFENQEVIFTSNTEDRLSFPRFQSEYSLLFAIKAPNTKESINSLNISSKEISILLEVEHLTDLDVFQNTPFALTEQKGVQFIRDLNTLSKTQVSSNIKTLSFKNKNDIFIEQITSKGSYIFKTAKSNLLSKVDQPIEIQNQAVTTTTSTEFKTKPYSSFSKLQPHYIVPNAVFSPYGFSGDLLYGLSIGSQDPLGLNSYSISASTDTITEKTSASLNYTSRHTSLPISFSAGVFNQPLSETIFRESTFASLGTVIARSRALNTSWSLSLQSIWNSTDTGGGGDIERLGFGAGLSLNSANLRSRELAPKKGFRLHLGATHYMKGSDYYDYGQGSFGFRKYFASPLSKWHRIIFGLDGGLNSKSLFTVFSSNSLNQPYRSSSLGSLALRGLPTGSFFAKDSFAVAHLEYRFPLLNINWGPGLLPGFFKRVHGAFTADYGSIKGTDIINLKTLDPNQPVSESNPFVLNNLDHSTPLYSAGAEIVFEGKLFYHLPASLQIGVYKFLNSDVYSGSPEIFVGFGVTGLPY